MKNGIEQRDVTVRRGTAILALAVLISACAREETAHCGSQRDRWRQVRLCQEVAGDTRDQSRQQDLAEHGPELAAVVMEPTRFTERFALPRDPHPQLR